MNRVGRPWRFLVEERGYRRLWLATAVSELGTTVLKVAFLLLIHGRAVARGGTPETANALILIAETLPMALLGPFAGALVDRHDRRRLLVLANLCLAALAAAVPFLAAFDPDWPLYLVAMAVAGISTVFPPTRQSAIPDLVGPARAGTANAISSSTTSFVFVIGAGLAGAILERLPMDACFWLSAGAFVVAIGPLSLVVLPRWSGDARGFRELLREVGAGLRYVRERPPILWIIACYFMAFTFIGIWFPLVPEYLRRDLGVDAELWLPRTWLAFGLGGIVGGALGAWIGRVLGMGRAIVLMFFVEPLVVAAFWLAEGPWAAFWLSFGWGILAFAYFVQEHTVIQQDVAPGYRGRVFGLLPPLQALGMLTANSIVLVMAGRIAPREMMLLAGSVYLVASTAILVLLPGGRMLWRRPNVAEPGDGASGT